MHLKNNMLENIVEYVNLFVMVRSCTYIWYQNNVECNCLISYVHHRIWQCKISPSYKYNTYIHWWNLTILFFYGSILFVHLWFEYCGMCQFNYFLSKILYLHRIICLNIKSYIQIYIMFDGNHNLILKYSIIVRFQVVFFAHTTYIEELLLNLRLNSSKKGVIFAMYQIMREKWTFWYLSRLTYMISCMSIMTKCQWRNIFQIKKRFLKTTGKCQL